MNLGAINKKAALIHVVVDGGPGAEIRPHGNHEMNVIVVEGVDHAFGIGIVFVEDRIAHDVPPEPILHDVVERDVQAAIFLSDGEKLRL